MTTFQVEHSYRTLPGACYADCAPTPVRSPSYIAFNQPLAEQLQLPESYYASAAGLGLFSGNHLPAWTAPLAQAYAGHQFANYVPRLGDGRALLLAEVRDHSGQLFDLQLKGAGRTPFSRGGDGRAPLGPVLREYLVSEAMHALGVPTTRALAAVSSGELVFRDEALPGAILTRVASSHLRIGSLQYAASQPDPAVLSALADYVLNRHYPHLWQQNNPYLALLDTISRRQAELVAQWMSLGFIHGVMNTDNMTLSGETIDYGPCAFMEAYNPRQVYSYIDQQGRYAYQNQAAVAQWNLARLAEALLPLLDKQQDTAIELAMSVLNQFPKYYQSTYQQRFLTKLGISTGLEQDAALITDFLNLLAAAQADFTLSFRDLLRPSTPYLQQQLQADAYQSWYRRWQQRLEQQQQAPEDVMAKANPVFTPRNHLIQQVIDQVSQGGDLSLFNQLHQLWQNPYQDNAAAATYSQPASPEQRVCQTFCGT
jgi:uncharacterized protein YdiU (UPF0061 family)